MVKKKGKSKRTTLKDKYKMQRRVGETHRKRKKQAKRDEKNGIVRPNQQKRDPGIPNSWPFKQDLLKDIQRARERQQEQQQALKEKRKGDLRTLRDHQEKGGSCKTVQELMARANQDREAFAAKQGGAPTAAASEKSDGRVAAGQQSRRAYLRELKKVVDSADVLLQVLDARDPIGSRIHKTLEDVILSKADKKMVLVLNKIDLVPKEVVGNTLKIIKMKTVCAALLAGSAAAFAPASTSKTSTALKVSELELGVTEPLGVFDPLGWLESEPEAFERRRAVERKHGRIAMAAVVGNIVHNNHIVFDGYISPSNNLKFSDIPTGIDGWKAIPTAGLAQIFAFFALVELAWMPASKYDGDYGVGYFGTDIKDPAEKARKLNVELNNGRAAMMGIIGNMVGECLTGQTMYEQYAAGHISPFGDGSGVF